jgi:hypothetical protein
MIRYLFFTATLLLISGCASMDKDECQTADWRAVGYEDGAKGRALSYLGNHRKACSDYGISPDMDRYELGRLAGLQEYCTPSNGFASGKSGQPLNTVCKPPLADDFKLAWSQGLELHKAQSQLRNSERTLERHQEMVATLQEQIEDAEAKLVSDGISSKKRKALLAELKDLNAELEDAKDDLFEVEERVVENRDYLEQLEARHQY